MKGLLKQAVHAAAPFAGIPTTRDLRAQAMVAAARWAGRKVTGRKAPRRSTGGMAMRGLAAAAVALPIGLWVGSRMRG